MYQHNHGKPMSVSATAQLLSNTLYYKRFFPFYTFNLCAGLDEQGGSPGGGAGTCGHCAMPDVSLSDKARRGTPLVAASPATLPPRLQPLPRSQGPGQGCVSCSASLLLPVHPVSYLAIPPVIPSVRSCLYPLLMDPRSSGAVAVHSGRAGRGHAQMLFVVSGPL
jgi:hypothetical protein